MERKILILYGSQTGNAQEVAERIFRESKRLHFQSRLAAFDDYDIRDLIYESLALFVCSTTGQGEEPDNMKKSWRFLLRKSLPTDSLTSLRFGVLGLGDSSYVKFNFPAKKLHKRLVQLGAFPIQNIGLCDDQHDLGPDFVLDPWIQSFWEKALEIYPLPLGLEPISAKICPQPRFEVIVMDSDAEIKHLGPEAYQSPGDIFNENRPYFAKLVKNQRQTSLDHFQDTRLIEFQISDEVVFDPGDVCYVQPRNLDENVEMFFKLFPHLDKKTKLRIKAKDENSKLPPNWILGCETPSILSCAQKLWDLQAIPKRYFFELLSHFTSDDTEKEKLLEFNTAEGQEELYNYVNRPRRNILEVLWDFRHTTPNIPLEYLFDLFPTIRPRPFSIASSSKVLPNKVQLLVAVVKYRSKLVKPRLGLCSNYLANSEIGSEVAIWTKSGTFRFPKDKDKPLVLVGPGTGLAPFRSLITENFHSDDGQSEIALFFGCRSKAKDFYFEDCWHSLQQQNPKFSLFCAFSRDQADKVYVQHLILKQEFLIRKLIWEQKGSFFIAGNAKQMPDQVTEALKKALRETVGYSEEKVEEYVRKMISDNRFQTETWS